MIPRQLWIVLGLATGCAASAAQRPAGDEDGDPPPASGAVCPVHDRALEPREVPIQYGLPIAPTRAHQQAEQRRFPHATVRVLGGCVPRAERSAWIESCAACREVRAAWLEEHEQYPGARLPLPEPALPGGWLPG